MIDLLEAHDSSSLAILDCRDGSGISYGCLRERVGAAAEQLTRQAEGSVTFLVSTNTIDSIVLYLACLEASIPVCLLEPFGNEPPKRLIEAYRPRTMLVPPGTAAPEQASSEEVFDGTRYRICTLPVYEADPPAHPDLALLLTTSGSTGTPKLVRLTLKNVLANARSIVTYLGLDESERSIQGLPMYYSYGLSLINSHLLAGGTVVLTAHSFLRPEFWTDFNGAQCTSFAGVPYMYETLDRLGFEPASHPSLRTMTQAGGGLRRELIRAFHLKAVNARVRLYIMYGQTEATARIAYVPHETLGEKIGSIGIAIPGGRMDVAAVPGMDASELVYTGPNVMMGYADSAQALALGDELKGVLHTGDLVERDSDGFFYLTGRLKRFAKLFGRRISLAEVENELESTFPLRAAVVEGNQQLRVFIEAKGDVDPAAVSGYLARSLKLLPKFVIVSAINSLPLTANGKKDYKVLCG